MDANYKPYKRYDDEFKRSAVELLETTGRPMAEVAGDLGIPYKALERWREKCRGGRRARQLSLADDSRRGRGAGAELGTGSRPARTF